MCIWYGGGEGAGFPLSAEDSFFTVPLPVRTQNWAKGLRQPQQDNHKLSEAAMFSGLQSSLLTESWGGQCLTQEGVGCSRAGREQGRPSSALCLRTQGTTYSTFTPASSGMAWLGATPRGPTLTPSLSLRPSWAFGGRNRCGYFRLRTLPEVLALESQ